MTKRKEEHENGYHRSGIKGYELLEELALNLRWSWNHLSDIVWQKLNPELWDHTHNPWVVLQTASKEKLEKTLAQPSFRKLIRSFHKSNHEELFSPKWFQKNHAKSPLSCVAYFSMEFMLTEALPIYSGGLGNVAGDQLKAASHLGVPIIGVGLLYQQGYFRQMIDKEGSQLALYPYNEPGQLPITPVRKPNGEWLRLETMVQGYSLWIRAWQVQIGRVKLYLLDTNDAANFPAHRGITSELYGGGNELRLKQEMLLGVMGWRLLEELGLNPEVCHLNEGHAALAVVERAASFMRKTGQPFSVALAATRAGNVFTTHTAVPAGLDSFAPCMIEQYLGGYAKNNNIPFPELLALGQKDPSNPLDDFNMAYLAIRGSGRINGVSRLHGEVSRKLFSSIFPRWPIEEIPVKHVTNGIHTPSWDFIESDNLWTECCGKNRWLDTPEKLEKNIRKATDQQIWKMRRDGRESLVKTINHRFVKEQLARGLSPEKVEPMKNLFDSTTLLLGFARRFATYKRPNMLLHNPDRLLRILNHPQRPAQLVIAGKAHPKDKAGQALIQQWTQFIQRPEAQSRIIFLSDYDMLLTEQLVKGVDVWINTPRRPWEACGTSGMKVLVNGGLNLSELDGWWAEAYSPQVGWSLGDGKEHGEDPNWDAVEAEALYNLLEYEVIPEFYNRNEEGLPEAWVHRIRESMAQLTPQFSAIRTVHEYTEKHYLPAAALYKKRTASKSALSRKIVEWNTILKEKWPFLRFGEIQTITKEEVHEFELQVHLKDLDPLMVRVELYAMGQPPTVYEMTCFRALPEDPSTYIYRASVPSLVPKENYTPRIIPNFAGAEVPLESPLILWKR